MFLNQIATFLLLLELLYYWLDQIINPSSDTFGGSRDESTKSTNGTPVLPQRLECREKCSLEDFYLSASGTYTN